MKIDIRLLLVFVGDRIFEIKVPKISIIETEHSAKNSQALARNLLDCLPTKREQADRTCYGNATKNRIQPDILRTIRSTCIIVTIAIDDV